MSEVFLRELTVFQSALEALEDFKLEEERHVKEMEASYERY